MKKIYKKRSALLLIFIFFLAFGSFVTALYGEKDLSELDYIFLEGKRVFFSELKLTFGLHPLKHRFVPEDIHKINHAQEEIPFLFENLINIMYLKSSHHFESLIEKGDRKFLKEFQHEFINLSKEAAGHFVESLFQEQLDNGTNLGEAISKGKTRLDLVIASFTHDGPINERKKELFANLNIFDFRNLWGFEIANFRKAHKFTKGKGVKITIIDSGIDLRNRTIKKANINHGISFCLINRKQAPWKNEKISVLDNNGHGTVIASIVSATAPELEIHIYKIGYDQNPPFPYWTAFQVAQAIYKAVFDKADVIVASSVFDKDFKFLKEACQFAYNNNVIIVCPNGTYSPNDPAKAHQFPAHYNTTITVGGVVPGHMNKPVVWKKTSSSHYTSVSAPAILGKSKGKLTSKVKTILSPDNSWAAAVTGGLVALISSRIPKTGKELQGQYFQRIDEILTKSATPQVLGFKSFNSRIGYGLINAEKSVHQGLEAYIDKMRKIEENFKKRLEEIEKQEEEKKKKELKKEKK